MAEPQPHMTGGQGGSTEPKEPLQQPQGAVEMKKIDSSVPDVPAKDDDPATADAAASSTSVKGKEKEVQQPSSRQDRADSLSIGAADDPDGSPSNPADGPVCNITLLLPTGARHPYKIDDKYLAKRNVEVPEVTENGKKDPFSVSVYKLKELILREWRDEWEGKPASPSSIRLIHFGKLLDDKEQLKKYQFSREIPNVVHMSVKPAEMLEEDEAGKGKSGSSGGRNSEGGSGCCVIL
ncbi:ubiquitin-related domain-containing protein [Diaporthe sp. PMI_573]|nr:ubiquitin-related domain-containing protein [Diaporthaceae sp. PMI_573]